MVIGPSQGFALRRHLAIPDTIWPVLPDAGESLIYHLGGAALGMLCELALRTMGFSCLSSNAFALRLRSDDLAQLNKALSLVTEIEILEILAQHIQTVEMRVGLPLANRTMPVALRITEAAAVLGLPDSLINFRAVKITPADSNSERLRDIL